MTTEPPIGAHLISPRAGYTHHGIYVGADRVIHYPGPVEGSSRVEETDLTSFCRGRGYFVKTYRDAFPAEEVVRRARSRLDEAAYHLAANNCEHFCLWCLLGDHRSPQVEQTAWIGTAAAGALAGWLARGLVATAGPVAGLSRAGVLSGLGAAGRVVGGGPAAGLAVLGTVPGAAMATVINRTLLADHPALEPEERQSRALGRIASYLGAGAGAAGSLAVISAAGATPGLSAAGITSGLAAIGGTVGGGMATGIAIGAAAPVVAAASLGYGIYKLVRRAKG